MDSAKKYSPSSGIIARKETFFPLQISVSLRNPSTCSEKSSSLHQRDFDMAEKSSSPAMEATEEDSVLSKSEFLTRQEVNRRCSSRVKKLIKCYRGHYWGLMEELKGKYREYYWKYGKSPFKEEEENNNGNGYGNRVGLGFGDRNGIDGKSNRGNNRCVFVGCKSKSMAMTNYCHPHILSDSKQKLYKACTYVIKSAQTGPIFCGKPILRSTVPSLCAIHFQTAQKHVTRALRKAGLNISSSSKLAPKFRVIVAESVHQIQAKRRAARKKNKKENADSAF